MEIAQAAEQRGIDRGGRRLRAVHPGENLLVGNLEPGLDFVELGVAQVRDMRVGETAERAARRSVSAWQFSSRSLTAKDDQASPLFALWGGPGSNSSIL